MMAFFLTVILVAVIWELIQFLLVNLSGTKIGKL